VCQNLQPNLYLLSHQPSNVVLLLKVIALKKSGCIGSLWLYYNTNFCALSSSCSQYFSKCYIILIPSHPVFALSPYFRVLSREATNTYFLIFGLTPSLSSPLFNTFEASTLTINYNTDAVENILVVWIINVSTLCFQTHFSGPKKNYRTERFMAFVGRLNI
jgi:hypothetical protein